MMCDKLIEDEKVSSSSEKWSENKEIGDIIEFGHYEQDSNLTNGKEPIEWIVIGKENNKVLLLSRYCLDGEIYNKRAEDVTWETCTLRKWLNDEFFKNAFSDDEQCYIITSILENKDNPWAGTKGGNQTTDKVFCLSIDEYEHAMLEEDISYGKPTQYAKSRGIEVYNNTYCPWWLRSIGINKDLAAFVWVDKEKNGALLMYGGGTEIWNVISVRPAIWLSLT